MILLALSGTHGTGKSTILHGGFNIDESQLSRSAQKSLGWDKLSIAGDSVENMWALQNAILDALIERDDRLLAKGVTVLVERSPADLWAYLAMWCKHHNVPLSNSRVVDYWAKCAHRAKKYDRIFIVPQTAAVPFVSDPNRATKETRDQVDKYIREFLTENFISKYEITNSSKECRIAEVASVIKACKG